MINKLEESCIIEDITKELHHKDIILLKELASEHECYGFASILRDMKPKI